MDQMNILTMQLVLFRMLHSYSTSQSFSGWCQSSDSISHDLKYFCSILSSSLFRVTLFLFSLPMCLCLCHCVSWCSQNTLSSLILLTLTVKFSFTFSSFNIEAFVLYIAHGDLSIFFKQLNSKVVTPLSVDPLVILPSQL